MRGVSAETILTAEPVSRNPRLVEALRRISAMGKPGRPTRGVERIFLDSLLCGSLWPSYAESTDDYVRLYLPRGRTDEEFSRMIRTYQRRHGHLSVAALMVLSSLRRDGAQSVRALIASTGYPPKTICEQLRRMARDGLIGRSGTNGRWFLLDDYARVA